MMASQDGRSNVVELLIEHGAEVNARTAVRLHTRDKHAKFYGTSEGYRVVCM